METIEAVGKEQSVEELEKVCIKIKLQPITMSYFIWVVFLLIGLVRYSHCGWLPDPKMLYNNNWYYRI